MYDVGELGRLSAKTWRSFAKVELIFADKPHIIRYMEESIGKKAVKDQYRTVAKMAGIWGLSERSVRNYCAEGRVEGAVLDGKTWFIPIDAEKPERANSGAFRRSLLEALREENKLALSGGIYQKVQIELTYNSNHIEGSRLTHEQTRYIYEMNTVAPDGRRFVATLADDVIETANHFRMVDMMIDQATRKLSENMLKRLHLTLKNGTSDSRKEWFNVGGYKKLPNEVGGQMTVAPEEVQEAVRSLLEWYNGLDDVGLDEMLEFHVRFEKIHPFQDGNGRIGRLVLFKECLRLGVVPFVIDERHKMYYYRGIQEWKKQKGFLRGTCLSAQDEFLRWMEDFGLKG